MGQSVKVSDRWPVQLARRMRGAGPKVADPEIIAQTGWTTGDLSAALDQAVSEGTFDVVPLLIGVNNQFHRLAIDQYQIEFPDLLQSAVTFAGGNSRRLSVRRCHRHVSRSDGSINTGGG